ncbi:hypothetical protein EXM65_17920 [Clostridium botulinum]|uniref:Uncharacterized protein n=1 Tax=Clostridium botulinum TaxID=1491 RepID=A0A6M0SSU2_CLOBO|nr:hypothetical protein [Clostridium botulinum]
MKQFDNYKNIYKYLDYYCYSNYNNNAEIIRYKAIINLYKFLEEYLNITSIQFERLKFDRNDLDLISNKKIDTFEDELKFTRIFADIHFLLVSIEKSYNIIIELYNQLLLQEKSISIKTSSDYKLKKQLRNKIEHMDEYIIKPSTLFHDNWFVRDSFTLTNNTFKLGKYEFELSESNLSLLYHYYDEITLILTKDYVQPVRENVDRILSSIKEDLKANYIHTKNCKE